MGTTFDDVCTLDPADALNARVADWTDSDEERLIHLWNIQGLSASACASHFIGRTRQAITSKVRRLRARGISMRDESQTVDRTRTKSNKGPSAPPLIDRPALFARQQLPAVVAPPVARPVSAPPPCPSHRVIDIMQLDTKGHTSCRFIYGEPSHGLGNFAWCGAPSVMGRDWCAYHDEIVRGTRRGGTR